MNTEEEQVFIDNWDDDDIDTDFIAVSWRPSSHSLLCTYVPPAYITFVAQFFSFSETEGRAR